MPIGNHLTSPLPKGHSMATYSSFSSIGVSTPFSMKHRGLKIALLGCQCTHYTAHQQPRQTWTTTGSNLGSRLVLSSLVAFFSAGKPRRLEVVNTRPVSPLSRYPDLQTGVSRRALMPTRRSTSVLGTAAAPRNGAARRGSQARTARKPPPVETSSYTSIRGTDISCSWLVRPELEARSRRQLAAYVQSTG